MDRYTRKQNQQDASYIARLWGNDGSMVPAQIKDVLTGGDFREAHGILRTLTTEELRTALISSMQTFGPISAPHLTTASFAQFITRFRTGVVDNDAEAAAAAATEARRSREDPSDEYNHRYARVRLTAEDLKYGGETAVTTYINRLEFFCRQYGNPAVLRLLPLAMKKDAAEWMVGLAPDIFECMSNDIDEWIKQLRMRFAGRATQFLRKADSMVHCFGNPSLSVRQYITKKQSLYREAGETDEDLVVRCIHAGLDPTLAGVVSLKAHGNTLHHFTDEVYAAEPSAQLLWEDTQALVAAAESRLRERPRNWDSRRPPYRYDSANTPWDHPQYQIPREAAKRMLPVDLGCLLVQDQVAEGTEHTKHTAVRGVLYNKDDTGIEFTADTASAASMMNRHTVQSHFPYLEILEGPMTLSITGIGHGGPKTKHFIRLPIRLRDDDGQEIRLEEEVHIVDTLACGILLGVSFLRRNKIDIIWAKSTKDVDYLHLQDRRFTVSGTPDRPQPGRALIYTA